MLLIAHCTLRRLLCLSLLALIFICPFHQAQGKGLIQMDGSEEELEHDTKALQSSLDEVIEILENDSDRQVLLESLKSLSEANQQVMQAQGGGAQQGLLDALVDTFNELGEQAGSANSPLQGWTFRLHHGRAEFTELLVRTSDAELARFVVAMAVLTAIWGGLIAIFIALGRMLAQRRGWPLDLPRDPRTKLLAVQFLRRMLPWALAFALTMGVVQWMPENAGGIGALAIAYVALCGRTLSVVAESVVPVFTRGHRYAAVRVIQRHGARLLFMIGALIALGDVFHSARLIELLGANLASLCSVLANALDSVLSVSFILIFRRPIKQLILNRPYRQRREKRSIDEVVRVVGNLWHVPALVVVMGSLLALFVTEGDVGTSLASAVVSAALLVLTLVVSGLLRRQTEERRTSLRRLSEYRKRLERFGDALTQVVVWAGFAELLMQVWGGSLIGIGRQGVASVRIGQALLGIGFTILLAWLAWIFADTAIQRGMISSASSRGQQVNQARVQTITPMIRNVIFATIVMIAAIAGLANLGVNVTPLLAGAGVIGLAFGFGAQTLVQDLITGIFILIEDSLVVDDFVKINGNMGTVEGLTLRTVRLRDLDGIVHIVTFSRIESIHNMSRQFGIALIKIRIPYDMKIDDAISLMQETAQELRQDPIMRHHIWSPLEMQGVHAFEEGCPILRMRFRTAPEMQWDVSRAFNLLLKRNMEVQGVNLGVPRLSVSMEEQDRERLNGSRERGENKRTRGDASGRVTDDVSSAEPADDTNARDASPDPG